MGEPLNNYNALVEAIQTITRFPFQLSAKRITVSTVGTRKLTLILNPLLEENYLLRDILLSFIKQLFVALCRLYCNLIWL